MKTNIVFFDTKPYDEKSFNSVNQKFGYNLKFFKNRLTVETAPLASGADVVCAFVNDELSKEVVEILKSEGVKLIALRCAGYNNVDLKATGDYIPVVRVPAYSPHAVAEHAMALILSLNRKIHRAYYRTRDNNFNIDGFVGFDLYQKTIGVVGTGKIGKVMIKILNGFGANVIAYDLYPDLKYAEENNFKYVPFEEILKSSDIITLHSPLTPETKHLIGPKNISLMKKGVMLINTSRGPLIDTKALIEGLKTGIVGGAGLDVYEEEADYFFEDFSAEVVHDDVLERLLTFPNVLITSHQAFLTTEALENIATTTLTSVDEFTKNIKLTNRVCQICG